jgi:hypothetical protein
MQYHFQSTLSHTPLSLSLTPLSLTHTPLSLSLTPLSLTRATVVLAYIHSEPPEVAGSVYDKRVVHMRRRRRRRRRRRTTIRIVV